MPRADRHEAQRRDAVSEQGERVRPATVAEVLETEEAKGLLESARDSGSLSTDEIAAALGEMELDAGQLDDFYHALEELQIEVVDDGRDDPESEPELASATREITT